MVTCMYKNSLVTVGFKFYYWLVIRGRELIQKAAGRGPGESEGHEWFLELGQEQNASATAKAHSDTLSETQQCCHGLTSRGPFQTFWLLGHVSDLGNYNNL